MTGREPQISAELANASLRPPQVWVIQPRLRFYRLPLWQRVHDIASSDYRLTVLGPLEEVLPLNATQASYLKEIACRWRTVAGRRLGSWPNLQQAIIEQQPEVVMFCATPSILSCWTLPSVVRRYGGAALAWSKIHSQSGRRTWWSDLVKRRFYDRFDRTICYGQQSRDELVSLGYPTDRVTIAQNTLDTDSCINQVDALSDRAALLRAEHGLTSTRLIVSIGRMIPRKRHLDLVHSWPELRKFDPQLRLVLIGSGPLLEQVRRAAAEIDSERILVTGAVPQGDDYAWLAAADIVVLPGALGLAINQSLALGCPTIIADEAGADAELVKHGVTGWRYPRGDLAALTALVRRVLDDGEQRRRVTATARQLMADEVTLDNLAAALHGAFHQGLALAANRRATAHSSHPPNAVSGASLSARKG